MPGLSRYERKLLGEVYTKCDKYGAKMRKHPELIRVTGWLKGGVDVARMKAVAAEWEANYKKKPEA